MNNNPDTCPANQHKWSYGSRKSSAVPYTPFEISNMRNINPCKRCLSRKTCKHEETPVNTPMRKKRTIPRINRKPDFIMNTPLPTGGALIGTHKKQVGFRWESITKPIGKPKDNGDGTLTQQYTEKMGIVKVQYVRIADKTSHVPQDFLPPQTPIAPRIYSSKHRKFQ